MLVLNRKVLAAIGFTAAAAVSTAIFVAPAEAAVGGQALVEDNTVIFVALRGKTNNLTITKSGRVFTLDDTVAVNPGPGCRRVDSTKVRCTTRKLVDVVVLLGDKNDKVTNKTGVKMIANGEAGNDKLTGGPADDILDGGAGNDKLLGGAGPDFLGGGAGNDSIDGGAGKDLVLGYAGNDSLGGGVGDDYLDGGKGADSFKGGRGFDVVTYRQRSKAVTADLDGAKGDDGEKGEKDSILSGVEFVLGGNGNDVLTGGKGPDQLIGGPGNDKISGKAGDDFLVGENWTNAGGITGSARAKDKVDGGAGAGDYCFVLAAGTMSNCELPEAEEPSTEGAAAARVSALGTIDAITAKVAEAEKKATTAGR